MEQIGRSTVSRTAEWFTHVGCGRQGDPESQAEFNIVNSSAEIALRVATLGRLAVVEESEEAASLGKQRRKLAVLVVLALSPRPRSRDALAEMFWGDQDEERARHSLAEALSHVRRVVGRDAIATRLSEVSLSPKAAVRVDAVEFERHVRAGEFAAAVELYEGPFLDGVHIEGSISFEQWVDERRAHFERLYVKAAAQHCEALARSRQWAACALLAARWLSFTPLSADAALYLLNARKAPGSREALEHAVADYAQLEARLRREYETEPEAVVAGLARGIAAELERMPASVGIDSHPEPGLPATPAPEPAIDQRRDHFAPRRLGIAVATTVVLIVGLAIASRLWNSTRATAAGAPTRIAVMPFVQIGSDSATAYFTRGMTDEVSVALGSVDGVRVLPVGTATAAGRDTADMRTLGQRLGADVVLAGSTSADGDSARIFARLISTKDGYQLWAGNFVRPKGATAGVHMDVARAIAAAIRRELSASVGTVAHGPSVDPETYDLYLRGRYFENRSGEANVQRAIDYYERALARDSTFAPAYAGLANTQVTLLGWGHSYAETVPLARRYADRALAIDPSLGVAHFVLGRLDWYDWRWADSEREYLRALADNPSDVQSHHMLSHTYLATGKIAESLIESRTALELEPLNPRMGLHLCVHHMLARQLDSALVACRRGIELDSTFPDAHAKLSYVYFHMRRYDEARAEIEREMAIAGRIPLYVSQLAMIEAGAGRPTVARQLLADLNAQESPARLPLFYIAAAHVQLGEIDSAMVVLEAAYSNHASELDSLLLDPAFDALRGDARFAALLRKLGETAGGRR